MKTPSKPGWHRAKLAVGPDGKDIEPEWAMVRVFEDKALGNELRFNVPGYSGSYPVLDPSEPRSVVVEWGTEVYADEFRGIRDALEKKANEADREKDGSIGKFMGMPISESLSKKVLIGIILANDEWNVHHNRPVLDQAQEQSQK